MPMFDFTCQNESCGHELVDVQVARCCEDPTTCPKCGELSLAKEFPHTAPPIFTGVKTIKGSKPRT